MFATFHHFHVHTSAHNMSACNIPCISVDSLYIYKTERFLKRTNTKCVKSAFFQRCSNTFVFFLLVKLGGGGGAAVVVVAVTVMMMKSV